MKRTLSIFTATAVVFSASITAAMADPTMVKTPGGPGEIASTPVVPNGLTGSSMDELILSVKNRLEIPLEAEDFNSNVYTDSDSQTTYNFNWTLKTDGQPTGNISASVYANGIISNYYKNENKPYNPSPQKSIPKLSRAQLEQIALDFFHKVNPDIADQFRITQNTHSYALGWDNSQNVSFERLINGIPFESNSGHVSIDGDSGAVRSFAVSYSADVSVPAPNNIIDQATAKENTLANQGMELAYVYRYNKDDKTARLIYAPAEHNYGVDAFTGNAYKPNTDAMPFPEGARKELATTGAGYAVNDEMHVSLTPAEIEVTDRMSEIISLEQAEQALRAISGLEFDGTYTLTSSSLYSRGDFGYVYNLYFEKPEEETNGDARIMIGGFGVHASIDALTGGLVSFNSYSKNYQQDEYTLEWTVAKEIADDFLSRNKAEKFASAKVIDNQNQPFYGTISYNRFVNDIRFLDNSINVQVNNNKKIVSYNENWVEDVQFGSADGVITEAAAKVAYAGDDFDVALIYLQEYTKVASKSETKLIYRPATAFPAYVDAKAGVALDWQLEPYKTQQPGKASYTDLDGHWVQDIVDALSEIGVSLEGSQFMPDEIITQADYLLLVAGCTYDYYFPLERTKEMTDTIYTRFTSQGVIKRDEEARDMPLTRENAVKLLLKAMDYAKTAELEGIFLYPFSDIDQVDPSYVGYIAIAKGLGLVNGSDGAFMPKSQLTRAEAVQIIYNYLAR